MKAWNILFGLLFVYAAIVQYNDPDAWAWVLIYLAAAAPCLLRRLPRLVPAAVGVAALVWMLTLLPAVFRARDFSATEIERESFGLLLVAGWMTVLFLRRAR